MHPEQLGTYIRAHLYSLYSRLDHARSLSEADYLDGAIKVSWHYLEKFDIPFDTYEQWKILGEPNKQKENDNGENGE